MVRRTKEDALLTRERILDAAEGLFRAQGVATTSLHQIAQAASVTRGAIYWHFEDKVALFDALLARVVLPLEAAADRALVGSTAGAALPRLQAHATALFAAIEDNPQVQRVLEIMTSRVEYIQEMGALRERQQRSCQDYAQRLQAVVEQAQRNGEIDARLPAQTLALGLFCLVDGLIRNWVLDPRAFSLRDTGGLAVSHHLAGWVAGPQAGPTASVKPTRVTPS